MLKVALCCSTLLAASVSSAAAQLISIRTVPVSQAHQFEIFPSRTVGMGGVSIAVTDSLRDPFSNPAHGSRLGATRFFGTPSAYSVSSGAGGGRTLPIGALTRSKSWYGGVWLALQQVDMSEQNQFAPFPCPNCFTLQDGEPADLTREQSQGNTYAFVMLGRELREGFSVGGSVTYSRLNAVDGVDLLYAGSANIDQYGHSLDVRVGFSSALPGDRSLEAIVLHNRYGTTHDVFYLDSFWDPGNQQFSQRPRLEKNLDRSNTWGLHVNYEQPFSTQPGWRAGVLFTMNRMDHPKIPNYAIMNIPRDPGNSSAFNLGLGISRTLANSTFGVDVIYEPIWSHTWADAANPIETNSGEIIPAGGMTIENRFRFHNAIARFGIEQGFKVGSEASTLLGGFQLGLSVRRIDYVLEQHDHIVDSDRRHKERWVESTPTWGLSMRFPHLEVRYNGSVTHGTGRPGIEPQFIRGGAVDLAVGGNILAAPSGPLTLDEVKVTTHQISVSLPVR
jgi:hypothetical protein